MVVTVWLQLMALLHASRACHVRVALKVVPTRGLVVVPRTVIVTFVPLQRSIAEGGSNVHAVPHSTNRLEAHVSTGGVVSATVMVWLQVAVLLQLSLACHVRVAVK